MTEIIIGSLSIIAFGIFIMAYFIKKHKQKSLEEVFKSYMELLELFKTYPKGLKFELRVEYQEIKKNIKAIEAKYKNLENEKDIYEFINQVSDMRIETNSYVKKMKEKWDIYEKFINDVNYIKLSIENFMKDLEDRKKEALFYDEDDEGQKKLEELYDITKKEMDDIYNEYDIQGIATFSEFDYYILDELEKRYAEARERAERAYLAFVNYFKTIEVYFNSLSRKTVFYITLKELLEGTSHGRNKSRSLGEITVSAKTYEKLDVGSNYKKDILVTSKRINTEIFSEIKAVINDEIKVDDYELSYKELMDLLKNIRLPEDLGETDDEGIPYNFEVLYKDFKIGEKDKKELSTAYSFKNELFERLKF